MYETALSLSKPLQSPKKWEIAAAQNRNLMSHSVPSQVAAKLKVTKDRFGDSVVTQTCMNATYQPLSRWRLLRARMIACLLILLKSSPKILSVARAVYVIARWPLSYSEDVNAACSWSENTRRPDQ